MSWTFDAARALLRGYQLEWIAQARAENRDLIHVGGRQIGKDFTWSFDDAEYLSQNPRKEVNVISATGSHSEDYLRDTATALSYLSNVASKKGRPFPSFVATESKIVLENGSRMRSFAPVPRSVIGRRDRVVLNEFGIMPNAKAIFEAAEPLVRAQRAMGRQTQMRIMSNASVTGTALHSLWEGAASANFIKLLSPWEEVMRGWLGSLGNPLAAIDAWIDSQKREIIQTIGVAGFAQWYCCQWRPRNEVFFDPELLVAALYDVTEARAPDLSYDQTPQVLGMDIGRHNNPSVITPLLLHAGKRWSVKSRVLTKMPYAQQIDVLGEYVYRRRTLRGAIDRTGLGDAPAEDAIGRWPSVMFGVHLAQQSIWQIWSQLRADLESDLIRIDSRDVDLFMELSAIEATMGDTGKVKIKLGSSIDADTGVKRHGDVAMAFALANYAANGAGLATGGKSRHGQTWKAVPAGKKRKHSWHRISGGKGKGERYF